ncbi:unnamed protein product [Mytilus edulis]|uniref:Peptidase M16 middle/third domain-containing protein n=1 Tax=Mytilus edulis TaxID=6550 RepID=A0A8S3UID0_MYTED|nr:unnamed protein product [Mytilus edulis]
MRVKVVCPCWEHIPTIDNGGLEPGKFKPIAVPGTELIVPAELTDLDKMVKSFLDYMTPEHCNVTLMAKELEELCTVEEKYYKVKYCMEDFDGEINVKFTNDIFVATDFDLKQVKEESCTKPQKSVVLQIEPTNRKKQSKSVNLTLNESPMPVVDKSPHLGILRSTSSKNSQNETTEQNITKSRRAAYSLMSAGLHGENGLDPITSLHLIKTFIQPILTYGLEVILPTSSNLLKLEKFQKQLLKRIMSLPICTPDPSIYILSGFLPIEAQIDQKALILFNNICRQDNSNLEKKLAIRQLSIKDQSSNSWFIMPHLR